MAGYCRKKGGEKRRVSALSLVGGASGAGKSKNYQTVFYHIGSETGMNEHCQSSSHYLNNNHTSSLLYPTTTAETFLTNRSEEYIDYDFRDPSLNNFSHSCYPSGVSSYDGYQNQFRCSSLNFSTSTSSQYSSPSSYDYRENPEYTQLARKTQFEQNNHNKQITNNHGNSLNEADKCLEMFGQQLHTIRSILEKKNCSNCKIGIKSGNDCSACYKYKYRHGIERPVKVHTRELRGAGVCANCGDEAVKDECFKCHTYKTRYNKPRPKRLWKKKVATSECNNCGIPTTRASCQACYKYKKRYGVDRPEGYWKKRIVQYNECCFCKRTVTSQWYNVGDKKECSSCYFRRRCIQNTMEPKSEE